MRYAAIRSIDISNGKDVGCSLFVQGCSIHCKGCFQPQTWDFDGGKEYTQETENKILELIMPEYIKRFSILGGEPLEDCNLFTLAILIKKIKATKPHIKIWLYTGYTAEQLLERIKNEKNTHYLRAILDMVDILVAGPFIEEQKDLSLPWCGSRNQQVIHWNP